MYNHLYTYSSMGLGHLRGVAEMETGSEAFEVFEVDKTVDIFDPLTRNQSVCNTTKYVS